MYLLDTNVISELRKAKSRKVNKHVMTWAKKVPVSMLYISVLSILEIEIGINLCQRKDRAKGALLRTWLDSHVIPAFSDRILQLDVSIAQRCAKLHIPNPKSDRDAIIAATALVHGMTVVTRNVKDFHRTGVAILNPWEPIK